MSDLGTALRAKGKRLTPQRRRILDALAAVAHGTPDLIGQTVAADGGPELPLSTIYRGLEVLEELGFVGHTHLDHRAPSYHLAEHATHIHLVCLGCGTVSEAPVEDAATFTGNLRAVHGFEADVTHMAVHGWCVDCAPAHAPRLEPVSPPRDGRDGHEGHEGHTGDLRPSDLHTHDLHTHDPNTHDRHTPEGHTH
ncbi:MAG: transcriptional repressor [Lapillicoccus sp.]